MTRATLTLIGLSLLAGCSSPVFYHKDPARHVVVLDQERISVLEIESGRWQAYGGGGTNGSTDSAIPRERQIRAIELVSGCTVTQSDVDPVDARLLTASVRCQQ